MAQSALTVTSPTPTPPTNLSSIGMTPPDPGVYLANVYDNPFNMTAVNSPILPGDGRPQAPYGVNPNPAPYFDDGVANTYPVISQNEGGGVNGTTVPSIVGSQIVFSANHAVVANSGSIPSVAHEGAGTELLVTLASTNPGPAGQLRMISCGPVLTPGTMPTPNATHPSCLSNAVTSTITGVSAGGVHGPGTTLLTVTGTNFNRSSVVYVSGVAQTTNFVSATSLTVTNAPKNPVAGNLPVTVVTSGGVPTAATNWVFT